MDNDKQRNAEQIIYTNFVEQVFRGRGQLLVGVCLQVAVMLCVFVDTQNAFFVPFVFAAIIVGLWRLWQIDSYKAAKAAQVERGRALDRRWYERWELHATLSAISAAGVIGGFGGTAFYWGESNFSVLVSVMIVFATLPSVVVRLYGSMRVVISSTVVLILPLTLAVIVQGAPANLMLAFLSAPFVVSAVALARSVRSTFVFAVMGNLEKRQLDARLRDAVGSMSHGMIMVDDDERIIVVNEQCKRIFNVASDVDLRGRKLPLMIRYLRRKGGYGLNSIKRLTTALDKLVHDSEVKQTCQMQNGQVLELSGSLRSGGGHVILVEDISEQEATRKSIEQMRSSDSVTGLPNRETFHALVAKMIDTSEGDTNSAMIVFDIDDFKTINDNAGHMQGDRMLKAIGMAAKRHLGRTGIVCRQGADEFLAYVQRPDLDGIAVANELGKKLSRQFNIGGEQFAVTVSTGVAALEATDHDGTEAVIRAGVALVEAKANGIGLAREYNAAMDAKQLRRQFLKNALANAINKGEIKPLYQPVVDAKTGRLVGCEALARWESEAFGIVSADEFIPLAEEMGHITLLTKAILTRAIADCASWPEAITVSVNLSARDFQNAALIDWLIDHVLASGLEPDRLEVEITETSFIQNQAFVARKLNQLRHVGVRVALDDFGTGYSSFNHLHRLPLDRVKIDRSFLEESSSGEAPVALLDGILGICSRLGLMTTVEGVETVEQVDMLNSLQGVQRMQGFYFGSALPKTAIGTLANAQDTRLGKKRSAA
ncbi:MAG: EAL domain-containing protein [Pseudomonadota bacterium]